MANRCVVVPLPLAVKSLAFSILLLWSVAAGAQNNSLVKLSQLQSMLQKEQERIQVINFWATWCGPCVKELPLLEKLNAERKDVLVRLVSMDMDLDPDPGKVWKFVARKKIQSQVIVLDETNPNSWIDKLEKEWSGALPATLVINNKTGKRKFVERSLQDGDLEKLIAAVQ